MPESRALSSDNATTMPNGWLGSVSVDSALNGSTMSAGFSVAVGRRLPRVCSGVYCYVRRANTLLSETEQAALDALAMSEGRARSEVLRSVLDRHLNLDDDADLDSTLADLAAEIADISRTLAATDTDLRID